MGRHVLQCDWQNLNLVVGEGESVGCEHWGAGGGWVEGGGI